MKKKEYLKALGHLAGNFIRCFIIFWGALSLAMGFCGISIFEGDTPASNIIFGCCILSLVIFHVILDIEKIAKNTCQDPVVLYHLKDISNSLYSLKIKAYSKDYE